MILLYSNRTATGGPRASVLVKMANGASSVQNTFKEFGVNGDLKRQAFTLVCCVVAQKADSIPLLKEKS